MVLSGSRSSAREEAPPNSPYALSLEVSGIPQGGRCVQSAQARRDGVVSGVGQTLAELIIRVCCVWDIGRIGTWALLESLRCLGGFLESRIRVWGVSVGRAEFRSLKPKKLQNPRTPKPHTFGAGVIWAKKNIASCRRRDLTRQPQHKEANRG